MKKVVFYSQGYGRYYEQNLRGEVYSDYWLHPFLSSVPTAKAGKCTQVFWDSQNYLDYSNV